MSDTDHIAGPIPFAASTKTVDAKDGGARLTNPRVRAMRQPFTGDMKALSEGLDEIEKIVDYALEGRQTTICFSISEKDCVMLSEEEVRGLLQQAREKILSLGIDAANILDLIDRHPEIHARYLDILFRLADALRGSETFRLLVQNAALADADGKSAWVFNPDRYDAIRSRSKSECSPIPMGRNSLDDAQTVYEQLIDTLGEKGNGCFATLPGCETIQKLPYDLDVSVERYTRYDDNAKIIVEEPQKSQWESVTVDAFCGITRVETKELSREDGLFQGELNFPICAYPIALHWRAKPSAGWCREGVGSSILPPNEEADRTPPMARRQRHRDKTAALVNNLLDGLKLPKPAEHYEIALLVDITESMTELLDGFIAYAPDIIRQARAQAVDGNVSIRIWSYADGKTEHHVTISGTGSEKEQTRAFIKAMKQIIRLNGKKQETTWSAMKDVLKRDVLSTAKDVAKAMIILTDDYADASKVCDPLNVAHLAREKGVRLVMSGPLKRALVHTERFLDLLDDSSIAVGLCAKEGAEENCHIDSNRLKELLKQAPDVARVELIKALIFNNKHSDYWSSAEKSLEILKLAVASVQFESSLWSLLQFAIGDVDSTTSEIGGQEELRENHLLSLIVPRLNRDHRLDTALLLIEKELRTTLRDGEEAALKEIVSTLSPDEKRAAAMVAITYGRWSHSIFNHTYDLIFEPFRGTELERMRQGLFVLQSMGNWPSAEQVLRIEDESIRLFITERFLRAKIPKRKRYRSKAKIGYVPEIGRVVFHKAENRIFYYDLSHRKAVQYHLDAILPTLSPEAFAAIPQRLFKGYRVDRVRFSGADKVFDIPTREEMVKCIKAIEHEHDVFTGQERMSNVSEQDVSTAEKAQPIVAGIGPQASPPKTVRFMMERKSYKPLVANMENETHYWSDRTFEQGVKDLFMCTETQLTEEAFFYAKGVGLDERPLNRWIEVGIYETPNNVTTFMKSENLRSMLSEFRSINSLGYLSYHTDISRDIGTTEYPSPHDMVTWLMLKSAYDASDLPPIDRTFGAIVTPVGAYVAMIDDERNSAGTCDDKLQSIVHDTFFQFTQENHPALVGIDPYDLRSKGKAFAEAMTRALPPMTMSFIPSNEWLADEPSTLKKTD